MGSRESAKKMPRKTRQKTEFGDFQTPDELAKQICGLLDRLGASPASVVEPTCGEGSFLRASEATFQSCETFHGYEINQQYVVSAKKSVGRSLIKLDDFFSRDWRTTLGALTEPILVVGNPPWVTNSTIGLINGTNLPTKSNFQGFRGFDAITGKSNFDISEWMLIRLLDGLAGRAATLAMLCKTIVARKVLRYAWDNEIQINEASIYIIDAANHFGAAVDACLLVCMLRSGGVSKECKVFDDLDSSIAASAFGMRDGRLVSDLESFDEFQQFCGASPRRWRSGVKHDCSKVMEMRSAQGTDMYINGFGETIQLESEFLYPMLKSSDLMRGDKPTRYMLVTQHAVGEDTGRIAQVAPLTWSYLRSYGAILDGRTSLIYRKRPRFSVFGIGEYSFAKWKVAISGFYKRLEFRCIGPSDGKPVVFDDTCYFLPCETEAEAERLTALLNSEIAKGFFQSIIFWDAKRPITIGLLDSLDLSRVAGQHSAMGEISSSLASPDEPTLFDAGPIG